MAWRVDTPLANTHVEAASSLSPVLVETLAHNEIVGILDPATGVVTLPEDMTFRSVEEFIAELRQRRKVGERPYSKAVAAVLP